MAHLTFEETCKFLEENQLGCVSQPSSKKQIFISDFGFNVIVENKTRGGKR